MGHPSVTLGLKCGPEMGAPICTEPIGHKFSQLQRAKSLSVTGNFSCAFLERRFLNCADMLALIIDLYGFPWVYTGAVHSGFCCVQRVLQAPIIKLVVALTVTISMMVAATAIGCILLLPLQLCCTAAADACISLLAFGLGWHDHG